ncbi:MAG: hypothetical protein Q9M50_08415 [Methylococcales bacterium]|nr:hypothetical protein [Methylococcales bacterium]
MTMSISKASKAPLKTRVLLSVWLSFMLLLVSVLHTVELNSAHYGNRNELFLIEFTLFLIVILLGMSHLISSFFYIINNNRQNLHYSLTCLFIILVTLIIAFFLDPETLNLCNTEACKR